MLGTHKNRPAGTNPSWAIFQIAAEKGDCYLLLWFAASAANFSSLLTWSRSSLAFAAVGRFAGLIGREGMTELRGPDADRDEDDEGRTASVTAGGATSELYITRTA